MGQDSLKHMVRILLTISFLIQSVFALNVKTLADIGKYTGTATEIIVIDAREYGPFYRYYGFRKADGFIIVADGKGRLWERRYRLMDGVDAGWFGAIGDGKQNALPYLKIASTYCMTNREDLNLPEPIYRVSGPWITGGMSISAADSKIYEAYDQRAPSYQLQGVKDQNSYKPFSIRGRNGTIIWGDFESDSLQAIMVVGLWGINYDQHAPAAEIKNITIVGKKGIGADGRLTPVAKADRKQVGLLMQRCDGSLKVNGVQFHGLETGLITNASYWPGINSPVFTNCEVGLYTHGSHSVTGTNMVGLDCGLAFWINSGASVFKQMNTERCDQSLLIGDGYNLFEGLYFESSTSSDKYQVQIGYESGYPVRGTEIKGMTLAATNGLILMPTAKGVSIYGSSWVSSGTKLTYPGNVLNIFNSYTDTPLDMPGQIFKDGILISKTPTQ